MRFPVVLHTDDSRHYGVTVPDIPGCFSSGESVDDALESVREAIDLHLEGMVEEGMELPIPSHIEQLKSAPEFADGLWVLIDVDMGRYEGKSVKINITLPNYLIHRIDDFVNAGGAPSRSGFLADAARKELSSAH